MIGNRIRSYTKVVNICNKESLVTLSRDNITSNAMRIKLEGNNFDKKLLEKFQEIDSNSKRRNTIISLIKAIELAKNTKYKDALKIVESIYKDENNPKK